MNIEKQIEFDRVKEIWMKLAVTEQAKDKIREAWLYFSENELKKHLKDTTDARNLIEKAGTPPLQNVSEIKDIIMIADKGDCLTPYQIERVEKVLVAVARLKDYLERGKMYNNSLAYYEENLDGLIELREEICRQIRNGRVCIPVKKEYKLKITGSIIDKSSTGNTLFIEPASVAKYYEELQMLKISEENEVYRILYTLSAMIAASAAVINENIAIIEKLDFIFSKGKLSIDMDAIEPSINTERRIVLQKAWHPLMDKNNAVPLQFKIGGKVHGIVITGPNTGGKTVAIKTVMLNSLMAQCGLHVTCKEADICVNSSYFCDIGDGQNLSENLSTFSAHISNVLEVLKEVNKDSFVIMDELGAGTDPAEGMGIAIAILEELRKSGAIFLITTHYPDVKEYARKTDDIVNARMTFDKETLSPTYQMVIGEAGQSCAFYIADRLGMPNDMLRVAIKAAYGEEAVADYHFQKADSVINKGNAYKISKSKKKKKSTELTTKYKIGDSVMVYPEKKIGIVCTPINEKGVLRVQLPNKKIWINHKRVKLHVAASELYPEDYDFSIIFETVDNRKKLHDMQRKYTDEIATYDLY